MRAAARSVLVGAAMLLVYASVPVDGSAPSGRAAVAFLAGLAALVLVTWQMVQQAQQEDPSGQGTVRIEALVALAYAVVVFFSLSYLALAERGQFADLENRVDALYFTMVTLATVGYGDVHPVGSVARAVVTVQIFFNLTVLAIAVRVFSDALARQRRAGGSPGAGEAGQPPPPGS